MPDLPRFARGVLAVLLVVCPLLFFTDLTRNPYYTQITILNMGVALLWLLVVWQTWKSGEFVWITTALDGPLLALFAVCVASVLASMAMHRRLTASIYSESSKALIFFLLNTYLVYAAALRFQDRASLRRIFQAIYAVTALAAVYGIFQYYGSEFIWQHTLNPYGSRPVSTFGNPNFLSSYLAVVIPVMLADYLWPVTGTPRFLLFAGLLASVGALAATLTRSSWAGVGAGVIVLWWGMRRRTDIKRPSRNVFLLAAVGLSLVFVFWPKGETNGQTVLGRLAEVKTASKEVYAPAYQRFLIWTAAWTAVEDHPILGEGWGCFELFYPFYQGPLLFEPAFRTLRTHANNAHNEFLEYWSQVGTVGLGLVLLLWIVFFGSVVSMSRRVEAEWLGLFWGLAAGVAAMLVDNLLNVSVHFAVPAFLFWWCVGSIFVIDPGARRVRRWNTRGAAGSSLLALTAAGLGLLIGRAYCLEKMEINFFEGFKLSKQGANLPAAAHSLALAYAWHPLEVNNNYELANVYARMGMREQATTMYQRALGANAGYDEIYFNRATMYMQMGRTAEAIADYRLCLEINPLSHDAYNALASLYFKEFPASGERIEALYQQGLELYPQDKDLWNNLGYLYTQEQKWVQAGDAYRHAIAIDPTFQLSQRNLAAIAPHLRPPSPK